MAQMMGPQRVMYALGNKRIYRSLLVIVAALILLVGAWLGFGLGRARGLGQDMASHSLGLVDKRVLEEAHPSYDQLRALEEQMSICEEQWYGYIQLVARQASIDNVKSPFLTELMQSINPEAAYLVDEANLWEAAQRERAQYQEKLYAEMEANLEERKVKLEKDLANKAARLEQQTRQETLNRQVELALRELPKSEAAALLQEIVELQAKAEEEAQRLQKESHRQLQAYADETRQAALEQLEAYDRDLVARMTTDLENLASAAPASTDPGEAVSADSYPEVLWQQQLTKEYWLNTGKIDMLEAQLLKERIDFEAKMQPLRDRYAAIQQEIEGDLAADIAAAAATAGLTLVLDKNQTQTQGIDITNQVLDILQGEA
ncbi:MAG: hypothetical protein GX998_11450 [Firmicutes bacterium]|nr:hypothetical protein [Bacillota bacterium]